MRALRVLFGLAVLVGVVSFPAHAGAHEPSEAECAGEEYAVVGDRADWAAVELAGWVLQTDCLLDSGDRRDDALLAESLQRYDNQVVYVVGGAGAVPSAKLGSLKAFKRLWGTDRLETMRAVVEWVDNWIELGVDVRAAQQTGTVRVLYVVPSDRQHRDEHSDALTRAMASLQRWYLDQLGGPTFTLYSAQPERCQTVNPDEHYFRDAWNKMLQDVQKCAPVAQYTTDYTWLIYADVGLPECGDPNSLGRGWGGLAMMGRDDLEGLIGNRGSYYDECDRGPFSGPVDRWIGGAGHELAHAFYVPHPPGCDEGESGCDTWALTWAGYVNYPHTYLREDEKALLLESSFITRP